MLSKITRVHETHNEPKTEINEEKNKQTDRQIYTHKQQANQATKIQKDCSIFDSRQQKCGSVQQQQQQSTKEAMCGCFFKSNTNERSNSGKNNDTRLMKWKLGEISNYQICHVPSISMGKFSHTYTHRERESDQGKYKTGVKDRQTDSQTNNAFERPRWRETVKQMQSN